VINQISNNPITSSLKGAFSANFTIVKPDFRIERDNSRWRRYINTGIGNIYPKAL